jgi:nicotinamidase-related amidase
MPNSLASAERLSAENAVFLPIDYMHGLMSACRSIEPGLLRNNALALARIARLFRLPTIGTGDRSGRTYLGAEMPELEQMIPEMRFINRSSVGAWDAPGYADLVRETGRRQLIMAGVTTEQCVTFTARSALAEGFQVYVVLDASASLDTRSEMAAVARLTSMGAVVTTWSPLAAELLGDFARPEAADVIRIYSEHQGSLRMVEDAFKIATAAVRDPAPPREEAGREASYRRSVEP